MFAVYIDFCFGMYEHNRRYRIIKDNPQPPVIHTYSQFNSVK